MLTKEDLRRENAKTAEKHNALMEQRYIKEILYSVQETEICDRACELTSIQKFDNTEELLCDARVEDFLYENIDALGRTAVLNFASYKNPGGGYMRGMMAQEEALCHVSTLYSVLRRKTMYYDYNCKHLNKGLYLDRALYSPNIIFDIKDKSFLCDVITCAAPNLGPIKRYGTCSTVECYTALKHRIEFIFRLAASKEIDTLVLGAFGCGVFKNNPYFVAGLMRHYTSEYDRCFKRVIHSIPIINGVDTNYKIFKDILNEDYSGFYANIDQQAFAEAMLHR